MRVLVAPRAEREPGAAMPVARALAGADGRVVSAVGAGLKNLCRPLSAAEVALLRDALAGGEPEVGFVCRGVWWADTGGPAPGEAGGGPVRAVAVTDHANLTWRASLTGPNDDRVGPRFPGMTGIYLPELVRERLAAAGGIIVEPGVVAGVRDDGRLTLHEAETIGDLGYPAVSGELVQVAIVAAHMGLRVAAAVVA